MINTKFACNDTSGVSRWRPEAQPAVVYNRHFAFRNPTVTAPLFASSITSLPLLSKGKVRDIYAVDAAHRAAVLGADAHRAGRGDAALAAVAGHVVVDAGGQRREQRRLAALRRPEDEHLV